MENVGNKLGNDCTCDETLLWSCMRLGEVYWWVKSEHPLYTFWAQMGRCNEGKIATRREAAEEDVGCVIFVRIRSEVISDVLGVLDSCRERVFWGFAVIGVKHYTLSASGDKRTEFTIFAESRDDKSRAAVESSASA
jgi:hypothetical protein